MHTQQDTPIRQEKIHLLVGRYAHFYVSRAPLPKPLTESGLAEVAEAGLLALDASHAANSLELLNLLHARLSINEAQTFLHMVAACAPLQANLPDFVRNGPDSIYAVAWATAYYMRRTKLRGVIVFDPEKYSPQHSLTLGVLQILHRESARQVTVVLGPHMFDIAEAHPDLTLIRTSAPFGSLPPSPAGEPATVPPGGAPPARGPAGA